jgi:outer membrane protein assembly factor BamB
MRALTDTGLNCRLRLCALLCISLCIARLSFAQQIQFGFAPATQAELTPPRVEAVSGLVAARLEQARALVANNSWDDAVAIYRELLADDTDRVVPLDKDRYLSLRTYCHLQIARLPAEALAAYRRQVDPLAEQWYQEGVARRDERLLHRIVDELFCSSWGDDALLALGDLALERADYAAARRYWLQTNPLLRSPDGLPLWIALHDIDLDKHWSDFAGRWNERPQPPEWLAYPDTQLELAELRARLVLVSLRAGESDRAALELDVLRRLHPQAVGRLGGQDAPLVATLERLLNSAGDRSAAEFQSNWPTYAGSPNRSTIAAPLAPILRPGWAKPVSLANHKPGEPRLSFGGITISGPLWNDEEPRVPVRESQRPLSCFPIVVGRTVLFADADGIHAADLSTGRPAITSDGLLARNESVEQPVTQFRLETRSTISYGVPRETLTAYDGIVYGRIGRPATTALDAAEAAPADSLVGLDLARDGLLTFRQRPADGGWSFDGVPLSDGRRLFVAMRHSDVTPHAYVACFDASAQTQLWRTSLGSADTPAAGDGNAQITHNLLTRADDRLYINTNLGLVAALDVDKGRICWLHRYQRLSGSPFSTGRHRPLHFDRDPSPCLYHSGLVVVAPSDAPIIFALDADTGRRVWTTDQVPDALHLVGVVNHNLIVSGNRLAVVDVRSGSMQFVWPESEQAGIRGMGRGVVAGEEIFWPTRHEIYVLHAVTGQRTRTPLRLAPISDSGANLVAAHGHLLIAGPDKLMALSPAPP